MTEDMVERVARALCARECAYNLLTPDSLVIGVDNEQQPYWRSFVVSARVAVEAMREPTPAMLDEDACHIVVGCCGTRPEHARELWRQMIDAVLSSPAKEPME